MKKLILSLLLCSTALFAQTFTVSGHVVDPSTAVPANSTVTFKLVNTGIQQCKVSGTGLIVPNTEVFTPNGSGVISGTLYRNDFITCGNQTNTQWAYTIQQSGTIMPTCVLAQVKVASLNLDSTACSNTTPVIIPPTGDNTYCRLDGSNCGFTAPITGTAATVTGALTAKQIQSVGLSLTSYGADPAGVADSTTAINNAIADSVTTGLPILCNGTFKITSTLNNIDPQFTTMTGYKTCTIVAGAVMTNMATIGGTAPPPYSKGSMQGITWDGNSNAAHGLQLGCSGVSCSTQWVNGMTFQDVRVKSTTGDCIQTGNNVWSNHFNGGGVFNCGGNGFTINTGNNAGEATAFSGYAFANNASSGLVIGNAGIGGASYSCTGCDFAQNTVAQVQLGTSSTNGNPFACNGCHFEWNSLLSTTRDIINFGDFVCSGCIFNGGTGNNTYRIDNERSLVLVGGTISSAGTGTILNTAQTGGTVLLQPTNWPNYATELTSVNNVIATDSAGNLAKVNTIAITSGSVTALNVTGGIQAGSTVVSLTGLKPAGGGTPLITGDGTNDVLPQIKLTGSVLGNGGNVLMVPQTAPTIAAAGCGGGAASIPNNNGTAAFEVNVGTTPGSACTITMPTAAHGWACSAVDVTTNSTSVFYQKQSPAASQNATTVVITNFNDVAAATAFVASDVMRVICDGY